MGCGSVSGAMRVCSDLPNLWGGAESHSGDYFSRPYARVCIGSGATADNRSLEDMLYDENGLPK